MINDNDDKRWAVRMTSESMDGGKSEWISDKFDMARTIRCIYERNVCEKCLRSKNQKLFNVIKMAVDKFLQENNRQNALFPERKCKFKSK